jgi:hypothetical protein
MGEGCGHSGVPMLHNQIAGVVVSYAMRFSTLALIVAFLVF